MKPNNLFPRGALCFDIGACCGESIDRLAAAGAGKIISVEPATVNYSRLLQTAQRHTECHCVALHAACWNTFGVVEISPATNDSAWSSLNPDRWSRAIPQVEWGKPHPVIAIPLRFLCEEFGVPAYCKIDVEGSEKQVLVGLGEYKPTALSFETHPRYPEDVISCLWFLRDQGYTKASFTDQPIDLETVPEMPIDDFERYYSFHKLPAGNVTLI